MSTLRERKEQFVTGLEGGSIVEINVVTSVALISYMCWLLVPSRHRGMFLDLVLNWVCPLLSLTLYANAPMVLILLMCIPCITFRIWQMINSSSKVVNQDTKPVLKPSTFELERKAFITTYRGGMLILTMIAILSVDFPIFPRRFAKVETWGTSLMDLGVGSFVFSNGLVSARALLKQEASKHTNRQPLWEKMSMALRSSASLLAIGVARLFFVKNLEYQEHVTEYGVHWNFFLTLSLLPPVVAIIDVLSQHVPRVIIATCISLGYEWCLLHDDSKFLKYLILSERTNIFNSNREGLVSFIGYCAIFIWGQNTGFFVLGNIPTKNNLYKPSVSSTKTKKSMPLSVWDRMTSAGSLQGLVTWTVIMLMVSQLIFRYHPFDVSRRFANLPYVAWVVTYNLGFLTAYCLLSKMTKEALVPDTLRAANSNGLILFLLSNVLTGLVNMTVNTLDASEMRSLQVLLAYCAVLAVTSLTMLHYRIFIKL